MALRLSGGKTCVYLSSIANVLQPLGILTFINIHDNKTFEHRGFAITPDAPLEDL